MKEFFIRLRHWLIKKLGGFTEQYAPVHTTVIRKADIQMRKVQAEMRVRPEELMNSTLDVKRYCESQLRNKIVAQLQESGDVILESQEQFGHMTVRATLYVVEGAGAALYVHQPMFERWN